MKIAMVLADSLRAVRGQAARARRFLRALVRVLGHRLRLRRSGNPVVWWMLSPPPYMVNAGDQAQAVAIEVWLGRLGIDAIELDKEEYSLLAPVLPWLVRAPDLILIHSGGNLGDRGIWTETMRRRIVSEFPSNRIVSLPQTIYFSATEVGGAEARKSAGIYATHEFLDVVARDPISLTLGKRMFPTACRIAAPDPVLSLPRRSYSAPRHGILMCVRSDNESALDDTQRKQVFDAVDGRDFTMFDTDLDRGPERDRRAAAVGEMLDLIAEHRLAIVDRFHGVIFAYLTRTPCIVLRSIDHKLTGGMAWFESCPSVRFAESPEEVGRLVEDMLAEPDNDDCDQAASVMGEAFAGLDRLVRDRLHQAQQSQ